MRSLMVEVVIPFFLVSLAIVSLLAGVVYFLGHASIGHGRYLVTQHNPDGTVDRYSARAYRPVNGTCANIWTTDGRGIVISGQFTVETLP